MIMLMLYAGKLTDRMLRDRLPIAILLIFLTFSLVFATENATDEGPLAFPNKNATIEESFDFSAENVTDEELLDFANENDTEEEPPPCSRPLPTKASSSDDDKDEDDDGGLPPEEEPPCVPPLEEEPTEEEPVDEVETTEEVAQSDGEELEDEADPTQLSLDLSDYNATNATALAGT